MIETGEHAHPRRMYGVDGSRVGSATTNGRESPAGPLLPDGLIYTYASSGEAGSYVMSLDFKTVCIVAAASVGALVDAVEVYGVNYHVGIDKREVLTFGTYAGLANPNKDRLTFLRYNDLEVSDPVNTHYHSIGSYSYTGPIDTAAVVDTNTNNQIPETFTGYAPLNLHPGSGPFVGKLVSGIADASPQSEHHYDRLEMRSVQEFASATEPSAEFYLYNSSSEGWNTPLGPNTRVALQLLSHSPELAVAGLDGATLLEDDGDIYEIGMGDEWSLTPVFWVDDDAALGTYSASFKLTDLSGSLSESGVFTLNFAVVPEPTTLGALLGLGMLLCGRRRILL